MPRFSGFAPQESTFIIAPAGSQLATNAHYVTNGTADNVEIQAALDALPSTGGKIYLAEGTYTLAAQVTRSLNNVIIEGSGSATLLNLNGSTAVMSAGSNSNWLFLNFRTDAGGLSIASATQTAYINVWLGGTHTTNLGTLTVGELIARSNDSGALGASGTAFSDLFLASGGVLNWNVGDVTLTHSVGKLTIGGDGSVEVDFDDNEITNVDINSGTIDGTTIGSASHTTIKGTTIDATTDFTIGSTVITDGVITDSSGLSIAANVTVTGNVLPAADDTYDLGSSSAAWQDLFLEGDITLTDAGAIKTTAGVLTLDSAAAINIEPASGSAILLDGTISVDGGVVTGATSVTSTAFVGTLSTASQPNVTTLAGLTTAGVVANVLALTYSDATLFHDANNADTSFSIGTSATEALKIEVLNGASNKIAESVHFSTATASSTADHGAMVFDVDGTDILTINDGGISIAASKAFEVAGTVILSDSSGTMTLSNVDALDATTEATIEAAIDTLGNLTSIGTIATGVWEGTDVGVAHGGTGRSTSSTAYALLAAGTSATGAHQTLAAGATTTILVGGGASALPVWTTATGSGAPVRANTPTLITPVLGAATGTSVTLGSLVLAAASITDTSGTISFGNENITTTGTVTAEDLVVNGDLLVSGDTVTVNTATLAVEDPLIILAKNNSAADSVDIGFYGLYDSSGSQDLYAGFFRDASDDKFHLFKSLQAAPTTTVNLSGTGYTKAGLVLGVLEITSFGANWTNVGRTIADLGIVTTVDINGGTVGGVTLDGTISGTPTWASTQSLNTSGNAATVTTNANLTGHVTSVGNAAVLGSFTSAHLLGALTNETGSGVAVFNTSPTLITPALGTPASGVMTNMTGLVNAGIVDGTITLAKTALAAGTGITLSTNTLNVDAAHTGITSVYNASLKMGRDSQNLIDFATTDNKIILRVNNVNEVELVENVLQPTTNDGVALGTTSLGWSDLHLASAGVINWANGQMSITETNENLLTVAGGVLAGTFSGNITGDVTGNADTATTVADNAITLAKLAGIARGKIIYGDASGNPAALAIGTDTYI